jgi:hypothetical protein
VLRSDNVTLREIVPLWDLLCSFGPREPRKRHDTLEKAVDQALAAYFR